MVEPKRLIEYGGDDLWSYAWIYLTIEGEQQWTEYIEYYGVNSRYLMKKVPARTYRRNITCEVSGNGGYDSAQGWIEPGCNNTVRDQIAAEYPAHGVPWTEFCGAFKHYSASYQYAPNFNWGTLNGGFSTGNPHTNYGLIRSQLTNGLQATRSNYGATPTQTQFNVLRNAAAATGNYTELLFWTSYSDRHLHAAW